MIKKAILTVVASFLFTSAHGATIVWNSIIDAGLSLPNGNMLPVGNLVRMGIFDISDAVIQQNKFDLLFLNSHFTQLGEIRIGAGVDNNPGYWATSNNVDTKPSVSDLGGKQIVLWGFAAPDPASKDVAATLANATHQGIYYADKSILSKWAIPTDPENGIPELTDVDLGDLTGSGAQSGTLTAAARIVVGNNPAITAANGFLDKPNIALAVIPEPATVGFLALGGLALFGRRRRC